MSRTTSVPFVTGNAAINAVEFYQIRKTLSDNPEPVQIPYLQVSVTTEDPKTQATFGIPE